MRISDWSSDVCSSDLTAFLIGPLTQFLAIPFMTTGAGAQAIGEWYGTGQEGGMALVFSVTGVLGVVLTLIAFNSRQYRLLSATYAGTLEEGALPSHPADSFSAHTAARGADPPQITFRKKNK